MMKKELNFPIVYQNDIKVGYGGNQEWFSQNIKRKAGCGSTSGANLAAYYASNYSKMAGIYDGNIINFNQFEYVNAMDEMYTYMRPGLLGYPYVKKYAKKFMKFCQNHGISLEANICDKFKNTEEAIIFVKENIDAGQPIALLILFHRAQDLRKDNWHWVTITGYIEDEDNMKVSEIILSNYGEREIVRADLLFEVHRKNTIRMVSFRIL